MSSEVYATTYFGAFIGGYHDGYAAGENERVTGSFENGLPDVIFNNEVGAFEAISKKCGGTEGDEEDAIPWVDLGFSAMKKPHKIDTSVYSGSRERAMAIYTRGGHDDDGDEIIGGEDDEIIGGNDDWDDDGWDSFIEGAIAVEVAVPEEMLLIPLAMAGAFESPILFGEDLYA